ncbi:MAG: ROK family protein, partial [Planctomycetota bacterium]|nr:ROK family protein [Planctomycetota bacterium]
ALEIGHLRPGYIPAHVPLPGTTVESIASGFGITDRARRIVQNPELANDYQAPHPSRLIELCKGDPALINTQLIAQAARAGDRLCLGLLNDAIDTMGWALAQAITLINPARIVIGGGVSLMGEKEFLSPVRRACRRNCFPPFVDLAEIVPAALEEEVVVHGALALARAEFAPMGT